MLSNYQYILCLYDFGYFKYLIYVEWYTICHFVTYLFHPADCPQSSSTLKQTAGIYFLLKAKQQSSLGFPVAQWLRIRLPMQEIWVWSQVRKIHLEKKMATHSSLLAWKIPWTEESGRLQSIRLQRVGHDYQLNNKQQWSPLHLQIPLPWWVLIDTCHLFPLFHSMHQNPMDKFFRLQMPAGKF